MRTAELAADDTLYRVRERYHGDVPMAVLDTARWYLRTPATFEQEYNVFLQRDRELPGFQRGLPGGSGLPCLALHTATLLPSEHDALVAVARAVRPVLVDEVTARTLRQHIEAAVATLPPPPDHLRTPGSRNAGMYRIRLMQPPQIRNVWLSTVPAADTTTRTTRTTCRPLGPNEVDLDAL